MKKANLVDSELLLLKIKTLEEENRNLKNKTIYGLVFERHEELNSMVYPLLKKKGTILKEPDKETNYLIQGDNYDALRLLSYAKKKYDLIYIDPPYNTGSKDFKYNDSFVELDDKFKHSKWLSFMEKRLQLAAALLNDNGIIFISIDENEFAQLKLLCDSIFHEDNLVDIFYRKKSDNPASLSRTKSTYEPVLAYFKKEKFKIGELKDGEHAPLLKESNSIKELKILKTAIVYDKSLEKNGFLDKNGEFLSKKIKQSKIKIVQSDSEYITLKGKFVWTQKKLDNEINDGAKIILKATKDKNDLNVRYLKGKPIFSLAQNIINKELQGVGTNEDGSSDLEKVIGKSGFSYPKPVSLIKYFLRCINNKNAKILDFFAGSGTTGQAVMELNVEDEGSRTFTLITNNENNICEEITYRRVKSVIEQQKLEENLQYLEVIESSDPNLYRNSEELSCLAEFVGSNKITNLKKTYYGFISEEYALLQEPAEVKSLIDDLMKKPKVKTVFIFSSEPDEDSAALIELKDHLRLNKVRKIQLVRDYVKSFDKNKGTLC